MGDGINRSMNLIKEKISGKGMYGMNELIVIDRDFFQELDFRELGLDALDVRHLSEDTPLRLGEMDRVYYFLSLTNGGLRYQSELILGNPGVAQWVILAGTGNSWALDGFRNALSTARTSIHVLSLADRNGEQLRQNLESIAAIRTQTCLIYSKRSGIGKRTAARLLSKLRPEWKFELCEGEEDILREQCAGITRVLIVGSTPQDFSLSRPERLEAEPFLLFNRCDENVQRFLCPEGLWSQIRMFLKARGWYFPQQYAEFYLGSALYEAWAAEDGSATKSLSLRDGFVMWDRYGLPVERETYTEESIQKFFEQFCALRIIGSRL